MKKLSVSKALIGLFLVLAVGIGFAACEIGTYEVDSGYGKTSIELASGGKATYTEKDTAGVTQETREGTYTVSGDLIVITWTSQKTGNPLTATPNYPENGEVYRLVGKVLYQEGSGLLKKSVDNEAIELELDLSAEELEALGL
ncbi:hypothetical protein AGMMS49579_11330 [Spirochaetia bacterium]|nr:hypothetical protein AGMMS49579_11330 [Spirochaetia bacterium]